MARCLCAVAIATAFLCTGARLLPATASAPRAVPPTKPAAAPAKPASASVGLHTLGRSLGFEVSWVVAGKKLRWKNRTNEVVFEVDKREITLNGVRVFMGDGAIQGRRTLSITALDRDRLLVPLLAPQRLEARPPPRIIALDPGHGGRDTGTGNAALKLEEKKFTLDVVKRLRPLLEARGFKVVLTRSDDTYVGLPDRPARAAAAGAELFVSVHFNATESGTVKGVETYTLTPQYQRSTGGANGRGDEDVALPGNACDGWNALLGYTMHRKLRDALALSDRGLKRARFQVLRELKCPGVLVEGGYLSNKEEAKRIATPEYRQRMAVAIADAITAYRDELARLARERAGGGGGAR